MSAKHYYIVFTDLKHFSVLTEAQNIDFQTHYNKRLAIKLGALPDKAIVWNTWGDAIFAAFDCANLAVEFLLTYRKFFKNNKVIYERIVKGKREDVVIQPRIAAHYGKATLIEDPLRKGCKNLYGENINTSARLEPVTRPGEIFATEAFQDAWNLSTNKAHDIDFEALGEVALAKSFGKLNIVRMLSGNEKPHVIDKLTRENLTEYLPDIPELTKHETSILNEITAQTHAETFKQLIKHTLPGQQSYTARLYFNAAQHALKLGEYTICLALAGRAEHSLTNVDGMHLNGIAHLMSFKKMKANALTRLSQYEEAANIVYGLWHAGNRDADTICMLAAQYKRRAIYANQNTAETSQLDPDNINYRLLSRANKLYVEAFRQNINDYYPAINATYLYLLGDKIEQSRGRKLGQYIINVWGEQSPDNWWLASTIAEAEMLVGDIEIAKEAFSKAIPPNNQHQAPDKFMLASTKEQIAIYGQLSGRKDELKSILALFGA